MIKVPITFRQTDDILEFVKITNRYPFHMDLAYGRNTVDAKSLMGTLALGQAKKLSLMIHTNPSQKSEEFLTEIRNFS